MTIDHMTDNHSARAGSSQQKKGCYCLRQCSGFPKRFAPFGNEDVVALSLMSVVLFGEGQPIKLEVKVGGFQSIVEVGARNSEAPIFLFDDLHEKITGVTGHRLNGSVGVDMNRELHRLVGATRNTAK